MVLANSKAFSGFAVDDLERAREFYEGRSPGRLRRRRPCDLEPARRPPTPIYLKPDHARDVHDPQLPGRGHRRGRGRAAARGSSSRATRASSRTKGIALRMEGGPPIAWFTDPAGNILAVLEE